MVKKTSIFMFILGALVGAYGVFAAREFIKGWRESAKRREEQEERDFRDRMVDFSRG